MNPRSPDHQPQRAAASRPVERLLAGQPLRRPGEALDRRVEQLLARSGPAPRGRGGRPVVLGRVGRWVGQAVAAAAVVMVAFQLGRLTTPAKTPPSGTGPGPGTVVAGSNGHEPTDSSMPVHLVKQWSSVEPGPVVYGADGLPVQPLRRRVIRRETWTDPDSRIQYEITEPVEQVILVPVMTGVD